MSAAWNGRRTPAAVTVAAILGVGFIGVLVNGEPLLLTAAAVVAGIAGVVVLKTPWPLTRTQRWRAVAAVTGASAVVAWGVASFYRTGEPIVLTFTALAAFAAVVAAVTIHWPPQVARVRALALSLGAGALVLAVAAFVFKQVGDPTILVAGLGAAGIVAAIAHAKATPRMIAGE